jgi:serine/threonine protein kinase
MSQISLHLEQTPDVRDPGAPVLGTGCLSENLVVAFVGGQASREEWADLEAHLDVCQACAELVFAAAHEHDVESGLPEPPWPTAFAVGSVLSERFTITRFVARGGMGEVYEAFDRKVPERVALKTMLCTLSDDPAAVRRLCEEVKLARRIGHRHVCRIHELHEHRDPAPSRTVVHFLAMELVDGETLADRLSHGPIAPRRAGRIARQLLEGLGAAHAAGVLHLDFKSQNVMLRAGVSPVEAVIMDFSLSRALEAEARLVVSERHLVGSPGYMSPEQLRCRTALGPPSDIYSFGVVLFEMLTGRLPFQSDRAESMMAMQLACPAPVPSQVCPTLTTAFDQFVAKCLAKHPGDRFADAQSALAALDRCLALPHDRASCRRRRLQRTASWLLLMVPLAGGVWASRRFDNPALGRPAAPAVLVQSQPPPALAPSASAASGVPVPAPPEPRVLPAARGLDAERPPRVAEAAATSPSTAAPASGSPASKPEAARPRRPAAGAAGAAFVRPTRAAPVASGPTASAPIAGEPASARAPWTPQRAPARLY